MIISVVRAFYHDRNGTWGFLITRGSRARPEKGEVPTFIFKSLQSIRWVRVRYYIGVLEEVAHNSTASASEQGSELMNAQKKCLTSDGSLRRRLSSYSPAVLPFEQRGDIGKSSHRPL